MPMPRRRRGKRVKQNDLPKSSSPTSDGFRLVTSKKKVKKSGSRSRHEGESQSGGMEALLPSFIAIIVLGCGFVAKMGFRGRATVAGIDLGTTNSVICVQQQSKGKEVGEINCIPDPFNNSPIVPSVISFLDNTKSKTKSFKKKEELGYGLHPSPSYVLVGSAAKERIDTHPHHTLYHAKRVIGRLFGDGAVVELSREVEFNVLKGRQFVFDGDALDDSDDDGVVFDVPFHSTTDASSVNTNTNKPVKNSDSDSDSDSSADEIINHIQLYPHQVGSYIINHLMEITAQFLNHDNVRSAVIAVPAKFNQEQRKSTVQAFKDVGVKVARILEEPVAAALAYGLQKKENVDFILVYDFGGGTLDVSVLQVFEGGYVEVIGNDGDNRLGGADFDAAVAHSLMDQNDGYGSKVVNRVSRALLQLENTLQDQQQDLLSRGQKEKDSDIEERLMSECPKLVEVPLCSLSSFHTLGESMKIELSSLSSGGTVSRKCYGLTSDTALDYSKLEKVSDFCTELEVIEFELSAGQYDSACRSLYERSLTPVQRILKDLDMNVSEIDEVVMVGGTTRMPQIREMVKKELNVESLNTSIDPDLTVAYGAASVID
eukprot:CAMPEP_0203669236 /NCGR_PEP_ID=MMETSP0090-20130426/5658_1 /ASSEMBLY_ACC=CAM_ASM_001088 /TAXON_ID=426623 /ORGANISM="Chaetoceros affinis, Strain CCMP159" /LENGTH=599 /DNA_ID=CAMNT_0050533867 /DNA_START=218 /DNA_END=2017 /DNA_ORIENTATION=+